MTSAQTHGSYLAQRVALALRNTDEANEAIEAYNASLLTCLTYSNWITLRSCLSNIATTLSSQNRLAKAELCLLRALDFAALLSDKENVFFARHGRFMQLAKIGRWADAEAMLKLRGPAFRRPQGPNSRQRSFAGKTELAFARFHFWLGDLGEEHLAYAEQLVNAGKNHVTSATCIACVGNGS